MCAYNKEYAKQYTEAHKEEKQAYDKARYKRNIEKLEEYRRTHKSQIALSNKKYQEKNQKIIQSKKRVYEKKRWAMSPMFRLNSLMSSGMWKSLCGNKGGVSWEDLVGYTLKQLKKHIEKQFTEGMSWENYGKDGWVIDHKIPKKVFNFTKPEHEDFKKCWALKNLQPMWEKENNIKSAKLVTHFQPSLLI